MLINTQIQPKPVPESGIQSAPTPTAYSDAGAPLAEVGGILKDLEGLTYLFWAEDLSSLEHVCYWGPDLRYIACLGTHLAKRGGPEVPPRDRFREPPDDLPAKANREKATAAIQACLAKLRSLDDVSFALVWHIEDDEQQIELLGFTIEHVLAMIGVLVGSELESYWDAYCTFLSTDANRRLIQ